MTGMIRLGDRIKTKKGYAFKSKWFAESGTPVVKATNFTDNSIDIKSTQYIAEDVAVQYKEWELRTNNVVVQTVGSWPSSAASVVGKCIRVPEDANGALLNQNTVILNCSDELDENFLYYSLKDKRFGTYIENRARGSANQASITLDDIRDFKIYSYDLEHQAHIGGVLRRYDDLIENNKRRIELLEESARQLYKEWFVRFRFPGHEHVKIIDGVPEGWQKTTYGEIAETVGGGTPSTKVPEYWEDGNVTWFVPKDLTNNNSLVLLDSEKKITRLGLQKSSAKILPPNTIMMSSRASIGYFGLYDGEASTNQGFISVIPKQENTQMYLLHNLMSRKEEIIGLAGGTTYKEINKTTFRAIELLIPPDTLSDEFQDFSSDLVSQVRLMMKQIKQLTRARDLLLPKLMSGEITV